MRSRLVVLAVAVSLGGILPKLVLAEPSDTDTTYIKAIYSLPLTLDPIQMNDTASLATGNMLYDGLLKFSPTLKLEPAIAKSWSSSSDGKTLTFRLNEKAKFHDQSPITALDVVESLSRAASKQSKVQKYYDCIAEVNGKVEIVAVDERTVQIKLKHPFAPFFSVLAGATAKILPKKLLQQKDFFDHPVGSGAFRFLGVNAAKTEMRLEAFAGYYGKSSRSKTIILKQLSQEEATRLALAGKVDDMASWPLTANDPVFKSGKKIVSPVTATWIIGLNTKHKPFDRLDVREAFRAAIDTDKFREQIFPDAIPAYGYVPPGLPGYIRTASVPQKKSSVIAKEKITVAIPDVLSDREAIKKFLESSLRKQGWNVDVVPMAWDDLMKGYSEKTEQAFLVSMNMDYPDAEFLLRNFESTNSDNFSSFQSKKLDDLLDRARKSQDRVRRAGFYREALDLVNAAAVTVNLFHPRANYWVSDCVEGFTPNILADVYIDYSNVRIKRACHQRGVE